jgi:predicted P-loop ATPase
MGSATDTKIDWRKHIEAVARRLLGTPNVHSNSRELRYGRKGSISVELNTGVWHQFEPPETGGGTLDLVIHKTNCRTYGEAAEWVKREVLHMKEDKPVSDDLSSDTQTFDYREYHYFDQHGELRYCVRRYMADKKMSQARWNPRNNKWVTGKSCMSGVQRLTYMLPQIIHHADKNQPLFIAEGEKDVEGLAALRIPATCNSGGAGNWPSEISKWFKDHEVIILPDNDDAGLIHARDVAQKLNGIAKRIRILELPGLPHKGDISDWFDAGGTSEELYKLAEQALDWEDFDFGDIAPHWEMDHDHIIGNSQANMRTAITHLEVTLSYNEFSERLLIQGPEGLPLRRLSDAEVNSLYLEIDEKYKFRPTIEFFRTVVENEARHKNFHPVLDYLGGLQWDGKPRIDTWLIDCAGADDNPYVRAVSRRMLIAAVRRVRQPGVKFDEMVVLINRTQGVNKSTALAVLAGDDEWFSADLPLNARTKEVIEQTVGKWIIEASELKGMHDRQHEHLKAFLSRQVDRARAAYGRLTTDRPRQFIIIGTTNEEQFLRDVTGNRRFWPIEIKEFDIEALRRDRDQLWAEGAYLEARDETIRLPPTLWGLAAIEQNRRMVEPDPWVEILCDKLTDRNGDPMTGKIKSEDVRQIIGLPTERRTQRDNIRVGQSMRLNGWEYKQRRFVGKRCWGYARGTEEEQQHQTIHAYRSDDGKHSNVQYDDDLTGRRDAPERKADEPKMPPIRPRD